MKRNLILVCEGPCSPQVAEWDRAAKFQSSPRDAGLSVTHRPHRYVSTRSERRGDLLTGPRIEIDIYACLVCGTERRFGYECPTQLVTDDVAV